MVRVAVVAFDGVVGFDLATPVEALSRIQLANGKPAYQVTVCGTAREVESGAYRIGVKHGLSALARAHTVIVPGTSDPTAPVPAALCESLRRAAKRGARIASICSGAFVLAAAGLLDGRRATTHWLASELLAAKYPKISVDPNVLFIDEGRVLTSAGAAAGIDLCLHLVRRDYGAAVAAHAARLSVMPLERDGGQAQFIERPAPRADHVPLSRVLEWLDATLDDEKLSLNDIARKAAVSVRSLTRHFRAQTGMTPLQWLLRARVRRAQALLETTSRSIEQISADVGFGSVAAFRVQFQRGAGTSPQAYRRAFQSRAAA